MVKNVYFLEFNVRLPNGKSETRRVEFDRQDPLLAFFEKAFSVKFKDHALGPQVDAVEGQRSSFYHFAFVDKRTGRRYLPYAEGNDGKRIYLDLRHIIATREFAQNMAVEVFLVYDHREPEGTMTSRYEGMHAAFRLDEFTSADLRMADIGRMMRKHYIGNSGEDFRFHSLQLRARMLADSSGKRQLPSPVFSFDGIAFSYSLPAGENCNDAPGIAPRHALGAPDPVMMLESQSWFGPVAGERVEQRSVPAILAQMPILAESLAISGFPAMMTAMAQNFVASEAQPEGKVAGQNDSPVAMKTARMVAPKNSLEAKPLERNVEETPEHGREEKNSKRTDVPEKNIEPPHAFSGEASKSQDKVSRRKAPFKPVPFSALTGFKAVIFDLDGVIVDSEKVHPKTFERALSKYNVKIDSAQWKREYTGIGSYAIFDDLVKKHGIKEDAGKLVKKRNEIYLEEIKRNKLPIIKGFEAVHQMLAGRNVKEAVASGGHANHVEESLRSIGLKNMPFVAIEHVKKGKPAPEIFLRAAKRLRVKPSECIVFEDSLSGVEAAAAAGMPCVALSTTMKARELRGKAALIVRNFKSRKLKRLLAVLLSGKENSAKANGARAIGKRVPGRGTSKGTRRK